MNTTELSSGQWIESPGAGGATPGNTEPMFRQLFEASADAIFLFDPGREVFVDCNRAAVEMMRATSKQQLLMVHPAELSPEFQPDGTTSREKTTQVINFAVSKGSHRFEWLARRMDGTEFLLEVLLTPIQTGEHPLMATVCRDITDRKRAERVILELNASLEQRVVQRTAALTTSEERFRALVEHAPEAIVVFDGNTGRFLFGNEHACRLYGVNMEKLTTLTPAEVSPEFQPGGRRSSELAREKMDEALAGGTPVFEWTHVRPDGSLTPTEVRLLRLPSEGRNLIRASIIDNTDRKRAQRELSESEEKFRALFEGSSQGVVLHDENKILEVNPAAVRIMGCEKPSDLLGKHPGETSPPFQPNGESSAAVARKNIEECMAHGSARFEWISCTPQGHDIPLEVTLTRIQWTGRQVIQALISDIRERKKAEAELRASEARLRESEARFSSAFHSSPIMTGITRASDSRFVLVNDAALNWIGCSREEVLGRTAVELGLWENPAERDRFWENLRSTGPIRQFECQLRNRRGKTSTMLASGVTIEINGEGHLLVMMVEITERKKAEAELQASETRLRESEARFSAAFHASPIITAVSRASDATFVLANDAFLRWAGYERDEVLGRTAIELGIWESSTERKRFWDDVRAAGSVRARECRLRNRSGKFSTMLASGVVIAFHGEDHLLGIMLDISQRKFAEAELHRTLAREMELGQLKSNFVSMVSHEFRTPLGIIQSSAELLRDFYQKMPSDERNEQLESITRNTRRMAAMMEEILVLSRLDAGKLDYQPTTLDFGSFCRRVVDEVLSATNRRCPIDLSLASIPPRSKTDERLLGHIFTNLLTNAVKYSEPGTPVSFVVERDGADAVCLVRDQGIGIPGEDQEHLFEAFYRGGNVGTRPGTGLGLLVVKRCVELHRGNVQLVSRLGEGTTVAVRVPVFGEEL